MYGPTSASSIHSESSEGKSPALMLFGSHTCGALDCLCSDNECALHPDYMLVKISFQYLIPKKNYNKPSDLENQ